ncbi:cytochrome C oxidase subunit IV family protein [Candidatus Venteria ishoeyi]|nr:cytochrome C oxidase subunit IV family protein [Candidatus Venteria ishoeyi]MDM8547809.1 cytochrome C oxidase subunit IV family protein [Candidatus Venteria ishoeyi]
MKHAEKTWLLLVSLTLVGTWLAETGNAGWPLTLIVVFLIGFKSTVVIDHYMEMRFANRRIRFTLLLFISLTVLMVIISYGWGDGLKDLTTIY